MPEPVVYWPEGPQLALPRAARERGIRVVMEVYVDMDYAPDGATLQADALGASARGFALAAEGDGLSWYVNGAPLSPDPVSGKVIWRPEAAGFYQLSTVDAQGRAAKARVRVKTGG